MSLGVWASQGDRTGLDLGSRCAAGKCIAHADWYTRGGCALGHFLARATYPDKLVQDLLHEGVPDFRDEREG